MDKLNLIEILQYKGFDWHYIFWFLDKYDLGLAVYPPHLTEIYRRERQKRYEQALIETDFLIA